ncbi:hypothetical protein JHK87_050616 [Glycine soja]|nr:hypothetical protein JHK87_050616 [Glycine soja]
MQHCYSLEVETKRVWDYVGDNYVHRLIQSKTNGKLVELNTQCAHADNGCGSCNSEDNAMNEAILNSKLEVLNKNVVKYKDIWKTKILRIEERYEEVIQLCGKTLDSTEKNACPLDAGCKSRIWIIHNSQKVTVFLLMLIFLCRNILKGVKTALYYRIEFTKPPRDTKIAKLALDWPTRKRIALGAARGLLYLHKQYDPKIIHRDVRAANILLDDYCEAVVGDFGLAKLLDHKDSHVTTSTLVRYQLPMVVIVFNNGGVRRHPEEIDGLHKDDPGPTDFVPNAGYHALIQAFGGKGYLVGTRDELKFAFSESFSARKPAVVNIVIDPYAGSESGRMQHKN